MWGIASICFKRAIDRMELDVAGIFKDAGFFAVQT